MSRPWYRWTLTAFAFPPSGLLAKAIAGGVDSTSAALVGGAIAGVGIGSAQWLLLRHRAVRATWIAATAIGLSVGLAVGAALVSYRTDLGSLAVMGAVSGLGVGIAQGAVPRAVMRPFGWIAATGALWALGWTITTAVGVDVEQQWVVFGAAGCFTVAFLQSLFIGAFVPAPTMKVTA